MDDQLLWQPSESPPAPLNEPDKTVSAEPKKQAPKKYQHSETRRDDAVRQEEPRIAISGKRVKIDDIPRKPMPDFPEEDRVYDYVPPVGSGNDFLDLRHLNEQMMLGRRRLYLTNNKLREAQRNEAQAEFEYRRAYSRILAGLSGGSERQRLAIADIQCEELWAEYLLAKQISQELLALVRAIRADLDSLSNLSHNIRAEIQTS